MDQLSKCLYPSQGNWHCNRGCHLQTEQLRAGFRWLLLKKFQETFYSREHVSINREKDCRETQYCKARTMCDLLYTSENVNQNSSTSTKTSLPQLNKFPLPLCFNLVYYLFLFSWEQVKNRSLLIMGIREKYSSFYIHLFLNIPILEYRRKSWKISIIKRVGFSKIE